MMYSRQLVLSRGERVRGVRLHRCRRALCFLSLPAHCVACTMPRGEEAGKRVEEILKLLNKALQAKDSDRDDAKDGEHPKDDGSVHRDNDPSERVIESGAMGRPQLNHHEVRVGLELRLCRRIRASVGGALPALLGVPSLYTKSLGVGLQIVQPATSRQAPKDRGSHAML